MKCTDSGVRRAKMRPTLSIHSFKHEEKIDKRQRIKDNKLKVLQNIPFFARKHVVVPHMHSRWSGTAAKDKCFHQFHLTLPINATRTTGCAQFKVQMWPWSALNVRNGMDTNGEAGMKWSGSKNGLLFKRQRTLLLCQPWIFQTWNRFSQQQPAKTPRSQSNSQVKAQVLPLLEEVIQNKFADEVWVEGVVYDLCPAKLQEKWQKVIRDKCKGVMSAAQYWNTVLLLSHKGHAKWKDFSNVTSHERKK